MAVKAVNFGSQTNEFGSQGGSQDVVEEWLKEDEHRVVCEERKVWDTPEMVWKRKDRKVGP